MKNQWAQYICQKYLYLCHSEYDKFSTQHFAISSYTPIYLPPKVFSIDLANSFTFKRSKISLLISFRTLTIFAITAHASKQHLCQYLSLNEISLSIVIEVRLEFCLWACNITIPKSSAAFVKILGYSRWDPAKICYNSFS